MTQKDYLNSCIMYQEYQSIKVADEQINKFSDLQLAKTMLLSIGIKVQ